MNRFDILTGVSPEPLKVSVPGVLHEIHREAKSSSPIAETPNVWNLGTIIEFVLNGRRLRGHIQEVSYSHDADDPFGFSYDIRIRAYSQEDIRGYR